jgi:eukaryotic-like serine/threonine-protein kinase
MSVQTPSARAIFERALELTSKAERQAYLDEFCTGHPDVRDKVESLLRAHADAGSFLAVAALDAQQTGYPLGDFDPIAERPGSIIGSYKLLEQIGEGGFGVVFMAEQERPVRRRVALKVIKPGMDTRQLIARFEAERQALALMDHPNIAKVLEAGATDSGRPYFVMELVRGIPITQFCDQNSLTLPERLGLFITICHAVQHAHQKGIIHRDLKPTNVLVTLHDGQPVAKVIDFGVAKATGQRLTDRTLFTAFAQMVGTPLYMSPEQAEMSGLDVDTRSDIYSLGVLLYELLTGTTPFDKARLHEAAYDEIRRIIRHEEPPKPSTRISSLGQAATTTSAHRNSEPDKLRRLVRGDLDWIVMKCLEKDRNRRYDTANGLAADVRRHLDNEPVAARPPTAAYRFRKAWRRNKLAYTAAFSVVIALVTGIGASMWQTHRALRAEGEQARLLKIADKALEGEKEQRKRAEEQRKRAQDQESKARRRAYAAEITAAFHALEENNLARAIELLNLQRPKVGEEDLRGFEWRLLWKECQSDEIDSLRDKGAKDIGAQDIAFSPDGNWLVYGNEKIVVCAWPSRAVVKEIPSPADTLSFSPDSKLLASGHDTVKLWSTESWQEVKTLPGSHYPALFSPDGQWLVTGFAGAEDVDGGYLVWNAQTWEQPRFCPGGPRNYYQSQHGVAFSPDGRLLVTPGHPGGHEVAQFQVWDFPSLTVRSNFSSIPFKLVSAVFTPDGRHLLTGDDGGKLYVWDVAEGKVVYTLNQHAGAIMSIAYAHDGRTFVTASSDRTLIVWDAATREMLVRLRGHLEELRPVAISPDGSMLASGSFDGTTRLWDVTTRHDRPKLPGGSAIVVGFSADSRRLVAGGWALADLRLWQLPDGPVANVPLENFHFHGRATWSDVYGIEPRAVFGQVDGTLEVWNLETMTRATSWQAHGAPVKTATLSPDAQFVATSDEQGEMRLWELATQREIRRFEPVAQPLICLTFSPDGQLLAGGSSGSQVVIWDVQSGRQLLTLNETDHDPSVTFSPDSRLLAAAMSDGAVRLWEIPSGTPVADLRGHVQSVLGLAFSPDGKTLVTGGDDRKVKLWNMATLQEVATLELLRGGCRSLKFSPDGRTLAAGHLIGFEAEIWLWQAPSLENIEAAEAWITANRPQP